MRCPRLHRPVCRTFRHFRATLATVTMAGVDITPADLRVDTIWVADGRPAATRVIYLPTGSVVRVNDPDPYQPEP